MNAVRVTVFNILLYATTIFTASVGLIVSYGPGGQGRLRWFLKHHSGFMNWLTKIVLGARIELRGLERFQNGERPAMVVSKHQSELDVFTPINLFPDLAAVSMIEISRYPLIGPVVRKLDFIMVSVEGRAIAQLRQVVSGAKKAHAEGRPILIYPEGELMRIGSRERYRTGVWHIYHALGVEATPVALSCGLVWPQRKWRKNIGRTCVIEFLEPIPPGLGKAVFMERLEQAIEEATMRLIREHGTPEEIRIAEERHRLGLNNQDPVEAASGSPEVA